MAAEDPFAQYLAPSKPAAVDDPFAQYLKPAAPGAAAPAALDLGTTAFWNKPANASWQDYMLAHLAKPFQGANQAAQDYARTAVDAATFGLGDRLQSALTGNSLEQERTNTANAAGRLGAMAPIVGGAMYAMGPGELGLAAKAAGKLGGGYLAGIAGSAAEGAGAGALGAAGHDESVGQGALYGGLLGSAGGALGGVAGRGGTLPAARTAADLGQQATTEYAPLAANKFGSWDVNAALQPVRNSMTQDEADLAKRSLTEVNALTSKPIVTGADIQARMRRLGSIAANSPEAKDAEFAPQLRSALQGVLDSTTPIQGTVGAAGAAKAAGDVPYGMGQDVRRLDDWVAASKIAGGPDVGTSAKNYLLSTQGKQLAPQGTPIFDAINTLAATAKPAQAPGVPNTFELRHAIHPIISGLGGAAAGAVTGGATSGWDPARMLEEAAVGGLGIYGVHAGGTAIRALVQQAAQQRALDAARATLSTVGRMPGGGYAPTAQAIAPVLPTASVRDALRTLIFGQGARGAF
jgi:hypothetical protein